MLLVANASTALSGLLHSAGIVEADKLCSTYGGTRILNPSEVFFSADPVSLNTFRNRVDF